MKIRLTLLFTEYNRSISMMDHNHIKLFLNNDLELPYRYITTKNPRETLNQICYDNFRFDPPWLNANISDFRRTADLEYEVVYSASRPIITNSNKVGDFYTMDELSSLEKKIGSYYEQILRSKNFIIH